MDLEKQCVLVCCQIRFPKSYCDDKQALLVLSVDGVCKFDRDLVSEVSSLWPYHWEMLGTFLGSDCRAVNVGFNSKSEDCEVAW